MPKPPDRSPSNEDLALRARQGCMPSFEELLRRFQVPLLHFLRQLGSASDAEDVLQETFVRAWQRLHQYRPEWRFSTWLFTVARRTSVNYHRRPRPTTDQERMLRVVSPAAGPAELALAADSARYLWAAAARVLGEEEHAALWLHYVEQMPVTEIAAVLDHSAVAVKTMMFRARKKLLPLLGDLQAEIARLKT